MDTKSDGNREAAIAIYEDASPGRRQQASRACSRFLTHAQQGMSLLEILIVLAILAVLSTYLIPSYHRYVRRGYRSAAVAEIYQAAQFIEQVIADQTDAGKQLPLSLPTGLDRSPQEGKIVYRLAVHGPNAENGGYTIVAEPTDTSPMRDDVCGSYLLDAVGRRLNQINGEWTGAQGARCWQR